MISHDLRSWFTIKNRIILTVSVVLGGMFAIAGIVVFEQVENARFDKINVRMETLAQKLRDEIDEQYEERSFPATVKLQRIITKFLPSSLMQLYDSTGILVFADSILQKNFINIPSDVFLHMKYFKNTHLRHADYRSLWCKIEVLGNTQWLLQIATPIENIEEDLERLGIILWVTLSFAVLLSALAVNFIVQRSFLPLSQMIETADRVSASSLHERIPLPLQHDEVSVLGSTVNRMIERLESAFKNQKQFIADASHELRTPLTIIQSELEFATRSKLTAAAKESIRIALAELGHLKKLAGDLLLLTRLEASEKQLHVGSVRLDELLAECVQRMMRASQDKHVSIGLTIHDILEIPADEGKLKSVIMNLLDNAVKYTSAGGIIEVGLKKTDKNAHITIHDTGIGITAADLPHIFDPFYRSDISRADHTGSGLGLSIVYKIIALHRGTIEVQSENARGSTFSIKIPI